MDRLAAYLQEFSGLLGRENQPVFVGIKDASAGLQSKIPKRRQGHVWARIQEAKYKPNSRPGQHLKRLETLLGEDSFDTAELKDNGDNVIYLIRADVPATMQTITIKQDGEVDGVVTGLVGADDTMHLYLRDQLSRDHRLVIRSESLARDLLHHFREGMVRVRVRGTWVRTEDGWVPEGGKCLVQDYDVLDESPLSEVMVSLAAIPDNGWSKIDDPESVWRDLRGIQ